jgi:hypothetical protein
VTERRLHYRIRNLARAPWPKSYYMNPASQFFRMAPREVEQMVPMIKQERHERDISEKSNVTMTAKNLLVELFVESHARAQ